MLTFFMFFKERKAWIVRILSLFRAVPAQCPAPFVSPAHAPLHHQVAAAGFGFSSSPSPWSRPDGFFSRAKKGDCSKSLAEIFVVCARVGWKKVGEAATLQAGSERLAGAGMRRWGKGLGVFRKFMVRSSNPVRKCGLRWHHRGWRGRQGCFPPRHKVHACRNFFFFFNGLIRQWHCVAA